jgi:hypothetical protein
MQNLQLVLLTLWLTLTILLIFKTQLKKYYQQYRYQLVTQHNNITPTTENIQHLQN